MFPCLAYLPELLHFACTTKSPGRLFVEGWKRKKNQKNNKVTLMSAQEVYSEKVKGMR